MDELDNSDLSGVCDKFIDILDRQLTNRYLYMSILSNDELNDYRVILSDLMNLYLSNRVYMLFTPSVLTINSEKIHKNEKLRELIREVVDLLYINVDSSIMNSVLTNICDKLIKLHNGDDSIYIGTRQYVKALFFSPDTLNVNILNNNPWLLFTLFLLICFDKSTHYQSVDKLVNLKGGNNAKSQ